MGKTWVKIFLLFVFLPSIIKAQYQLPGSEGGIREDEEMKPEVDEKIEANVYTWNLSGNGAFINNTILDTLQDYFHIFNPIHKNSITSTFTGNYGGSYLNNDFFARKYNNDFFFLHTHDAYLLTPDNIRYYNTTTPYTMLEYSQSEKQREHNETRFNVLHSQNVTDRLNFTLKYDQAKSDGQYDEQVNKNSFISLYSSYNSDIFNVHGGFISNSIANLENGGLVNDDELLDEEIRPLPDVLSINLLGASVKYKNSYYFATAEYKLGKYIKSENEEEVFKPWVGFIYSVEVSQNLRQFKEDELKLDANSAFFGPTLLDTLVTNDSIRLNRITNIFQIKQYETPEKKASFGKRAFIGVDLVRTVHPGLSYESVSKGRYTNLFVGGGIFRNEGNFWKWNAEGKFFITGYRSGQTEISASIWKPIPFFKDSLASIKIDGRLETLVPDYFQENFGSNRIRWDNRLNNEQRMTAGFTFSSPKRQLEAGVNYALINNYIYNDTIGVPRQTKREILVLSAFLNKGFTLKNFHIKARFLAQKSSLQEFIHLPEFSAHLSVYYKFVISKVLFTQLGIDARYNTEYYADAYHPATGLFYLQNEKKIGNYPYLDGYASLKLKRTRIFFKYINIGSGFINKEYFGAFHYPMNAMTFRLGVAWSFYD